MDKFNQNAILYGTNTFGKQVWQVGAVQKLARPVLIFACMSVCIDVFLLSHQKQKGAVHRRLLL